MRGGCCRSSRSSSSPWSSLPLGRLHTSAEDEDVDDGVPARVQAPRAAGRRPPAGQPGRPAGPTDLSDVPMFDGLPLDSRRLLERAARLVDVPAGTWLLREGDPPGSAYVVRRGRLEVDRRRTARARAGSGRRARRARAAHRRTALGERPRPPRLDGARGAAGGVRGGAGDRPVRVAVRARPGGGTAAHRRADRRSGSARPGPPWSRWWGCIGAAAPTRSPRCCEQRLARHGTVVALRGRSSPRASTGPRRSTTGCCWSPTAGRRRPASVAWRDFCLRQADAVVLVARADAEVPVDVTPAPVRQPDVVLLGRDPGPDRRAALGGRDRRLAADRGRRATSPSGLRALADRLAGRSLGLALARRGRPGVRPRRACCASSPTPACTSTGWPGAASAP